MTTSTRRSPPSHIRRFLSTVCLIYKKIFHDIFQRFSCFVYTEILSILQYSFSTTGNMLSIDGIGAKRNMWSMSEFSWYLPELFNFHFQFRLLQYRQAGRETKSNEHLQNEYKRGDSIEQLSGVNDPSR